MNIVNSVSTFLTSTRFLVGCVVGIAMAAGAKKLYDVYKRYKYPLVEVQLPQGETDQGKTWEYEFDSTGIESASDLVELAKRT